MSRKSWPFKAPPEDRYDLDAAYTSLAANGCDIDEKSFDFYERMYIHELDSREKVIARMQVSTVLMLALFSAQTYLVSNTAYRPFWAVYIFCFLIGCACLGSAASAYHIFRVLSGHTYRLLPTLLEIEKFRLGCFHTYMDALLSGNYAAEWARTQSMQDTARQLIVCATHNAYVNELRSRFVYRVNICLMTGGIFSVLAFSVYFFYDLRYDQVHRVELVQRDPGVSNLELVGSVAEKHNMFLRGAPFYEQRK